MFSGFEKAFFGIRAHCTSVCVFIKIHITAQPRPVDLKSAHSHVVELASTLSWFFRVPVLLPHVKANVNKIQRDPAQSRSDGASMVIRNSRGGCFNDRLIGGFCAVALPPPFWRRFVFIEGFGAINPCPSPRTFPLGADYCTLFVQTYQSPQVIRLMFCFVFSRLLLRMVFFEHDMIDSTQCKYDLVKIDSRT